VVYCYDVTPLNISDFQSSSISHALKNAVETEADLNTQALFWGILTNDQAALSAAAYNRHE